MYMITNPMEHPGILVPQSRSVIQIIKVWINIVIPFSQVLYLEENRPQSRYTGMRINHSRSFARCISVQQLVVLKITGKEGPLPAGLMILARSCLHDQEPTAANPPTPTPTCANH